MGESQPQNKSPAPMLHPFARSVPSTERVKRLYGTVDAEDRLAIVINADPDAIASALALKRLFWRKIKNATVYNINPIRRGDNLALIRLLGSPLTPVKDLDPDSATKFAMVDSQPQHNPLFEKYRFDIIIDHHPIGDAIKAPFLDVRPEYGAASSILTEYLKTARIKPSAQLATALFYGIKTDTFNFVRGGARCDMMAFRFLFRFANMSMLQKIESSEFNKTSLAYYRKAMENVRVRKQTAYAHMGRIANADICVQLADFFLKLVEVSWSIVSAVVGQRLVVVFRSDGYRRDAGKLAEKLFAEWGSAGGHKYMARAEIPMKKLKCLVPDEDKIGRFVYDLIRRQT